MNAPPGHPVPSAFENVTIPSPIATTGFGRLAFQSTPWSVRDGVHRP
jgi:hypothetical protein